MAHDYYRWSWIDDEHNFLNEKDPDFLAWLNLSPRHLIKFDTFNFRYSCMLHIFFHQISFKTFVG